MSFDQYGPSQEKCSGLGFSLGLSQTSWIKSILHLSDVRLRVSFICIVVGQGNPTRGLE